MPIDGLDELRFRQVHLDFHTSEHIEDIGADFEPGVFVSTLKAAWVNSVTLFARCHHGWAYYPSALTAPHPHLARPDLLGDMIEACHAQDIATPIYLPVQWDELTARMHPEWRVMQAENRAANYPGTEPSAGNQLTATWHPVCINHPDLVARHIRGALEVAERYAPPALFMDILSSWECCCNACLTSMQAAGLDPLKAEDRKANDKAVLLNFFQRFQGAISERFPAIRLFFNGGHIVKGEVGRYRHYGHLELESLPTGGWGYDHFPASARYAAGLHKPYLGMTGRFHTHWGEFGGYKTADALIFECCQMVMLGARCSIGDQLHPRGRIDKAAYDLIRPAYERVAALEPYARGGEYQGEVALLSVEAQGAGAAAAAAQQRTSMSDMAAARTLLELKIPFDVIEEDW
ncbi:MAG: beta-galactosidase, partial [Geminicoccaceae bacterium]